MGWLDDGPKDTSTPEQRKAWRDRAQEQMEEQAAAAQESEPGATPRHGRRSGLFT